MTSQRKMLVKLALNSGKESQEDATCVNSSNSGGIHRSGSTFDDSISTSSSTKLSRSNNSRDGRDFEIVGDSHVDKGWNPSSDEEISSEDEFQKDGIYTRKIRKVTEIVCTPDVTYSALSTSTAGQTPNLLVSSTPVPNSNAGPNTPELQSVSSTPASPSIAEISIATTTDILSPVKKGKRKRNESSWKRNKLKVARNSGKAYEIHSKKPETRVKEARKIKPPCADRCRLRCSEKLTEDERKNIFDAYWNLKDIAKQREFIHNCTTEIKPKYRYVREGGQRPRKNYNAAFFFNLGDRRIRVCKLFFRNTLDINDRPIRTVFEKKDKLAGAVMAEEKRGKHGNQPKMSEDVRNRIKDHINRIPKIESQNTTKHYIEGGRTITDIYNDYVSDCIRDNVSFCNFNYFYNIFRNDFNLSFLQPKKDPRETCLAYENAPEPEKSVLKRSYDQHLVEKDLSRKEKEADRQTSG